MVIALGLTVAAACYWYFRGKGSENSAPNLSESEKLNLLNMAESGTSEQVQDAILRLSGATSLDDLQATIKDALYLALPNVCEVVVYLLNPDTQELVSSDGLTHTLPKDGLGADVVRQRQRIQIDGIDPADPLSGLLKSGTKPIDDERIVLCSPVVEKEDDRVIALILSVSDELSGSDFKNLEFLEKQLAVCYHRIKKTMSPTPSHTNISNHVMKDKGPKHTESILELCAELYDQDAASLQLKVIKYLQDTTDAECGFLLLKSQEEELFCQVIGDKVLEEEVGFPAAFMMDTGNHQDHGDLHTTRDPLTLEDLHEEQRAFLARLLGYEIHSLLCVPVISKVSNELVALACLVNKNGATRFSGADINAVKQCFQYTATVLTSTVAFQKEQRLKNQTETLLKVAKNLFRQLDDLTVLLRGIMQEARNLTQAERCSVFLVEKETKELVAKVFDGIAADTENTVRFPQQQTEIRLPISQGIAGYVATTGEILNIKDAYSHRLFYRGMDEATGFRTRNILCFPIKDDNEVIGVAQLCNKKNGAYFTVFDVEIAKAFSVYCCISIVHGLMYQKVQDAQSRSRLANELMSYHMKVNEDDVAYMLNVTIPPISVYGENFSTFDYIPRSLQDKDLAMALMAMFDELGFVQKWKIRKETLTRFTLMMKRGYRDNPYHNWMHSFSVAHFCYLCIKNCDLAGKYLTDIEMLALFVGCIGHDIDHRGTNNSFQVASQSVLAALYSSEGSVMERHHFAQTVCILNLDSCNIFESMSEKSYRRVLDLIQHVILATDLAHHLRIIKDLQAMAENGWEDTEKCHKLVLCLLMTCCDLSDQTKSWQNSKTVAECVYKEFFSQGDLEKAMGRKPLDMMDRERACIPDLQIGFLEHICLPVFSVLGKVYPKAKQCLDAVQSHKSMWTRVSNRLKAGQLTSNSSLDIFEMDLDSEEERRHKEQAERLNSDSVREQPEDEVEADGDRHVENNV
ncbi:cGMP-dependent 3',5'-cyclic phosphodiesterase-like [Lineus longissimus]|uniref:cGMP-dependent 3',5'-cyclic phosphodiesterase-like n=1 Tax=Lineus longissimus TaxID=88925 RepID=UPI00315C7E24